MLVTNGLVKTFDYGATLVTRGLGHLAAATTPTATTRCDMLYTLVVNKTHVSRFFSFLGDGGKRLEPLQQYSVRGNLLYNLYKTDQRNFDAMCEALRQGWLDIVTTPVVVLYDQTASVSAVVAIRDNCLGVRELVGCDDGSFTPSQCN